MATTNLSPVSVVSPSALGDFDIKTAQNPALTRTSSPTTLLAVTPTVVSITNPHLSPPVKHPVSAVALAVSSDVTGKRGAKPVDSPGQVRCWNCGQCGHKANDCKSPSKYGKHASGAPKGPSQPRWQKKTALVAQSKQRTMEEALGAADAKIETLKDKLEEKKAIPNVPIVSEVKAVDFKLDLKLKDFEVFSQPLGLIASSLSDLDGNHIEDENGNNVLQHHRWMYVQDVEMDTKLDQRPVQYLGFETYKTDANLQIWHVSRRRRYANFRTVWRTGATTATQDDGVCVSMTMVANMIARDGVRLLLSATDEFLRSRYDIISTSVNIPQEAGIKENTITFLRDYCQFVCRAHHMLPDEDIPYFHTRLLDLSLTELPTGTDGGKSNPWVTSNLFVLMSDFGTSIVSITWIFLVFLLGLMLRGPFSRAQTLMTSVRSSEASPKELVVRCLKLIGCCFVGFGRLYAVLITAILLRWTPILMYLCATGYQIASILFGALSRYSESFCSPVASLARATLSVSLSLSVSHIIVVVWLSRKLVPLILDQTRLRPSVDQFLQRLSARSTSCSHLSSMCRWLIGLDM